MQSSTMPFYNLPKSVDEVVIVGDKQSGRELLVQALLATNSTSLNEPGRETRHSGYSRHINVNLLDGTMPLRFHNVHYSSTAGRECKIEALRTIRNSENVKLTVYCISEDSEQTYQTVINICNELRFIQREIDKTKVVLAIGPGKKKNLSQAKYLSDLVTSSPLQQYFPVVCFLHAANSGGQLVLQNCTIDTLGERRVRSAQGFVSSQIIKDGVYTTTDKWDPNHISEVSDWCRMAS